MARAKKRKSPVKPTRTKSAGIPAPFPVPDITGPTAQELATHDSAFLTQAILVKQKSNTPALPIHDDVMTAESFAMKELLLGTGYVAALGLYWFL